MPEQMNDWVEAQVSEGRYGNISAYFRDLVRRDQDARAKAVSDLRDLIDRAERSGISTRSFEDALEAARAEARAKGLLRGAD